jgi:RNAse (barnase) inhibitor barstar
MKQITLDGNILADAAQVHDYLKEVLNFPEYYGKNLDALYDCLTDLNETELIITAPEEDGAVFQKILRIFKAADRTNESLKLNLL